MMRLDQALVARGLVASRSRAQGLIRAGKVRVGGQTENRPAREVAVHEPIDVDDFPWVSRAALKLDHALRHFGIAVQGAVALDLGASTGGFTQVLRARGATRVYAVDVGHDQLHPDLRRDPSVVVWEGVNVRALGPAHVPEPIDLLVSDLSFISLEKALPAPLALCGPKARLVALIKPQFEVGPEHIGKGGLVRDPDGSVVAAARARVIAFLRQQGWQIIGETDSPILGGDGNAEYLVAACKI